MDMVAGDIITNVIQMTAYNGYFQPAASVTVMLVSIGGGNTIGYGSYDGVNGSGTGLIDGTNPLNIKVGITNSIYAKFYTEEGGATGYVFYSGIQLT